MGALVEARERGLVKHIGVSNFLPGHIDLLIRDTGVTPAVNQVELHPYFQQREQLAYDNAHGIITESWSPLGRANQMLREPEPEAYRRQARYFRGPGPFCAGTSSTATWPSRSP